MTIFNYSGSGSVRPGLIYKNNLFDSNKTTFDAIPYVDASISSFDKTLPTLDFSNSQNNSSASIPTTFDSGNKLQVTFDTQDQSNPSFANKSLVAAERGSGRLVVSSATIQKESYSYNGSGTFAFKSSVERCSSNLIRVNDTSIIVNSLTPNYYFIRLTDRPSTNVSLFSFSSSSITKEISSYNSSSGKFTSGKSILVNKTFDDARSTFDADNTDNKGLVFATFDKDYLKFTQFNQNTVLPLTYDSDVKNLNTFDRSDKQLIPSYANVSISYARYVSSGTITFSGAYSDFKATDSYRGSGSITLSGTEIGRNTESYVGSGSITLTGVEVEKNTESYVGSGSIIPGRKYIPPTVQTFDQTGSVFDIDGNKLPTYVSFDKDYLKFAKFNVDTVSPLTFDNNIINPSAFGVTSTQSIPNHGLESFVANPPENVELFNISGALVEKNTESYVGSGSINVSGSYSDFKATDSYRGSGSITLAGVEVEKNTESYVGTGIITSGRSYIPPTVKTFDQSAPDAFDRDGNVSPAYVSFDKDYLKFAKFNVATVSPLTFDNALINPSSFIEEIQSIPNHGLESFIANPPENVELFNISGALVEKVSATPFIFTPVFVIGGRQSGVAKYSYIASGSVTLSSSKVEKVVDNWVGSGSAILSGTLVEKSVDNWVGTGSITLTGVEVEKNTESYVGIGTVIFSGSYSNLKFEDYYVGSTVRITLTGVEVEKNVESYVGTGIITSGRSYIPPTVQTFDQNIPDAFDRDGNALPTYVSFDKDYLKFAKFNVSTVLPPTFDNALINPSAFIEGVQSIPNHGLESFAANPPENIQLFNISGSLVEKVSATPPQETETIIISGRQSGTYKYNYVGLGSLIISGTSVEKNTESYVGLGTITFSRSYSNLKATNSYRGSGSITLTGAEVEKNTESYVGSGSINLSGGRVYSETKIFLGSGSITLTGVEVEKNTESYVGTGIITSGRSYIRPTVQSFDQNILDAFDRDGNVSPAYASFDKDYLNFAKFNVSTVLPLTFDNALINPSSFIEEIQSIPSRALESFAANPPENVELFNISGAYSDLKFRDSYVGSGSINISGAKLESERRIYVGSGSINLYSTKLESRAKTFIGSGTITFSGAYSNLKATDSYSASGSVVLSGIETEKNTESYRGSGSITLASSLNESYSRVRYNGSGRIQLYSSKSESRSIIPLGLTTIPIIISGKPLVHPDVRVIPSVTGSGQINLYGSTLAPAVNSPVGVGTVVISGQANTFALLPITSRGKIDIYGTAKESYTRRRYIGIGTFTVSQVSRTRKVNVYTGVGLGTIYLSSKLREKNTESYVGSGVITLSGVKSERNRESYLGTGKLRVSGSSLEKFVESSKLVSNKLVILGTGQESFTRQRYTGVGTATFSGKDVTSLTFKSYRGSGSVIISSVGVSTLRSVYTSIASGVLRFRRYVSDVTYDTCDSLDITCDYLNSAKFALVSNPPENIQLFSISGSANTKKLAKFTYNGSGNVGISGFHRIKSTKSVFGYGSITVSSSGGRKESYSYKGAGKITVSSSAKTSFIKKSTSSVELFVISGSSTTKLNKLFRVSGIGTEYISSSALTRKLSKPSYSGTGRITVSGQLIFPNIKFIPAPKATGRISIVGIGRESHEYRYSQTSGILFSFSGGTEKYGRSGYNGIGTIHVQSTSGVAINNPYQIPRTYVCII